MIGKILRKLFRSENGATAVEYGLILALIVLAAMVAIVSLARNTTGMWDNVANAVTQH